MSPTSPLVIQTRAGAERRCSAQVPVTSALRPAEGSNVAHPFKYGQSKFSDLASGGVAPLWPSSAPTESCSVSWKALQDGKPHMHKHDIPPHCVKYTAMKTSHCYPVWGGHSRSQRQQLELTTVCQSRQPPSVLTLLFHSPAQHTGMFELIPDNDDEVMPEDP
ncbi:hypothetical protein MHYP_G00197640 [Metynnis hypsauchen]